jgi:hypothetical protein
VQADPRGAVAAAGCGDVYERLIGLEEPPVRRCGAMGKHRALATRKHRREPPAFDPQHGVPYGVDTMVHKVQPPRP